MPKADLSGEALVWSPERQESMVPSPKELGRRGFLNLAIAGIGGLMSAILGIPAVAYLVGLALKKQAEDWILMGSLQKVEPGTPTLFKATLEQQTGWVTSRDEISAYILTEDGQNYVALSIICTHLGCRVRWVPEQGKFFCPCHDGVFDKHGAVLAGPPPRPLDRFQTKIENGTVFIKKG
jgi:menaquinol-cytochrome c reductase iron-sulfur subunit